MNADKTYLASEEKETGRIEAFSDGVFAIAITLLILEIKVPHAHDLPPNVGLISVLLGQWPSYLSYFISFVTILIMWVSHHRLFNYIKRSNDTFLFLNGLLLRSRVAISICLASLALAQERPTCSAHFHYSSLGYCPKRSRSMAWHLCILKLLQ